MIPPKFPKNEKQRQRAVESYKLLDTEPEDKFDNITNIIAHICDTPISLITLLDNDRNFLKSHHGIPFNESPREISFCGHAINGEEDLMIVNDARTDERFIDNPLVTEHNAVFYAGAPLVNPQGYKLGTLCVYDTKPRNLSANQIEALKTVSKQVVMLFEQIIQTRKLEQLKQNLEEKNKSLEKFAGIVSHDLKSPLANIIMLTDLLSEEIKDSGANQYVSILKQSSFVLKDYIDGLLEFYRSDGITNDSKDEFSLNNLFSEIKLLVDPQREANFNFEYNQEHITCNKSGLIQILNNLITNAIKYNDKEVINISIKCITSESKYTFEVTDNGRGIPDNLKQTVFKLFSRSSKEDRYGRQGSGIGLATVKKIVTSLGGDISVESEEHKGSTFTFTLENF